MLRQYELVDLVKSYDPDADEDALNRAYVFAMKKHGAQLRTSGDPYYSHPVEVAGILTKFKLDSVSIIGDCCTIRLKTPIRRSRKSANCSATRWRRLSTV